jgi:putative endonuclease
MTELLDTKHHNQQIGKEAENKACHFLQKKGLQLLTQNYRCYHGEIDLIMMDKDDIVFVEVRKRKRIDYGNAFETVNHSKRKKIIKTAMHFLQKKKWMYKVNSRFDIIAIHPVQNIMQIEWIKNAFLFEEKK